MKIRSFRFKILGIIFLSTLSITVVLGFLSFEFSKRRISTMLGESIKGVAATAASFVNIGDIGAVVETAERKRARYAPSEEPFFENVREATPGAKEDFKTLSAANEIYKKYTAFLSNIKKINGIDGPINIYVREGKYFRIVLTSETARLVGPHYSLRPEADLALANGRPESSSIYKDKDGTWLSAYAPIVSGAPAVVEVTYKIDSYLNKLREEMFIILLMCLVVFSTILLASYKVANVSVNTIRQLNAIATDLEREHYDVNIDVRSSDEIGHLARTFEKLRTSIKRKITELRLSLAREKKAHLESIIALTNAIGIKDETIKEHLYRVEKYALLIAKAMQLPEGDIEKLRYGCYLHDIGKLEVEGALLQKVKLSRDDFEEVKKHSEKGAQIVEGIEFLSEVRDIILHHQEHYDGTGYPTGLKGKEIPFLARIVAVADAFDAMTADRPYRQKIGFKAAMDNVEKDSGKQFDPEVCKAFLQYRDKIEEIAKKHFSKKARSEDDTDNS